MDRPPAQVLHASCVAFGQRGVLILGSSGAGKSALALNLMALGAELVADDRVALHNDDSNLLASAPPGLPPLIEARGIGLLNARLLDRASVVLVVDLGQTEAERLPPRRHITLMNHKLEVVHGPVSGHFAAAIRHYILMGRKD